MSMEYENKSVALGSRAHNYLLLTLARQKLADAAEQIAPASCGWMDKDQLAGGLRMTPQQVDGENLSHSTPLSRATDCLSRRASSSVANARA